MNLSTPLLTAQLKKGGQLQFTQNSANLKVNGIMVGITLTVPQGVTSAGTVSWDFLKNIALNVSLRKGTGIGGSTAIISNVSLNALMHYSDVVGGVALSSTDFASAAAGSTFEMSGYLPVGFFGMSANDALETYVNVIGDLPESADASPVPFLIDLQVSAIYVASAPNSVKTYQQTKPNGSDQPYTNVLEAFYIGKKSNKVITLTDQLGSQNVAISSAMDFSNATGRVEFYSDIAQFYSDPFGLSQDMHFNCPEDTITTDAELLIVGYDFSPELAVDNSQQQNAQRENLVTLIRTKSPEKFKYLAVRGLV